MLVVTLQNTSGLAPVSDYDYEVRVNDLVIARGTVKGHTRKHGWRALLRMLVEQSGGPTPAEIDDAMVLAFYNEVRRRRAERKRRR